MAKDILGRHVRFLVDDDGGVPRDLSDDLVPNTLAGIGKTPEEVDMTGQSAAVKSARAGVSDSNITGQVYMNDAADRAFDVMKDLQGVAGTLAVRFGTDGAPANGDPLWEDEYILFDFSAGVTGGATIMNFLFKPAPGSTPDWDVVSGL